MSRIRNIEPDNRRIQCTIEILIVAFYQGEACGAAKNSRGKAAGQVSQESFYFNQSSGYLTCDHAIHNFLSGPDLDPFACVPRCVNSEKLSTVAIYTRTNNVNTSKDKSRLILLHIITGGLISVH